MSVKYHNIQPGDFVDEGDRKRTEGVYNGGGQGT
jgi:hypothetical protein